MKPAVLIIGLDGLNFDLVERLLPCAVMPTLHKVLQAGANGTLRSVIPTHSGSAWASFMTGQTPAGHGIFDFKTRTADGRYVHAKPNAETTLWHYLGQHGLRGGVFNFPMTYPPEAINGWLVGGMLSSSLERFTSPSALSAELLTHFPDYQLDIEWVLYAGRPAQLLEDATTLLRQRTIVAHWLWEREPLDYFAIAYTVTDRVQHALWQYLDPRHPAYDAQEAERLRPALHRFYRELDNAIASFLARVDDETTVILLSDHGFKWTDTQFIVNDWLAEAGFLNYDTGRASLKQWLQRFDTPRVKRLRRWLIPNVSQHVTAFAPNGVIDWGKTVAYNSWNYQQGVRLNLFGRDEHGIVKEAEMVELLDRIEAALYAVRHPKTGQAVVKQVYRTIDFYTGDYLHTMPDLLFDLHAGIAPGAHQQQLWVDTGWASADHHIDGMVALCGAGVASETVANANLIDIAPTVLKAFGLPIPDKMHGQPLDVVATCHGERMGDSAEILLNGVENISELTADEETEMLDRLRNLGYL